MFQHQPNKLILNEMRLHLIAWFNYLGAFIYFLMTYNMNCVVFEENKYAWFVFGFQFIWYFFIIKYANIHMSFLI